MDFPQVIFIPFTYVICFLLISLLLLPLYLYLSYKRKRRVLYDKLFAFVSKYGDRRRTVVTHIEVKPEEKEIAEVIPEDVVVVATQTGLIKKVPAAAFKVQRKGGKGVKSQDDTILDIISTNTVDTLMFFTTAGKMYRTVVDNVPNGTNATKGVPMSTLINLQNGERVIGVTSLHRATTPKFIIFITKNGMVKKSYLEEYFKTNRNTGIAALNIKEGDEVVDIIFQDEEDLVLITKLGMSIRFDTKSIGAIGRVAMGVKGIKLADGDEVVAALPVHKETDQVAVFTETGLGKKVALNEFPVQGRGGKGTYVYKPTAQTGNLVSAAMVSDEDNILLCGNYSSICISAKEVPLIGKTGMGNTLIKNNRVMSVLKL
jgi:DNA gyrase subunit A